MGQYINIKPASNLHHAIRIAEAIKRPLNSFVSINFSHTGCAPEKVCKAFQSLRVKFRKWITRPPARQRTKAVPATFVWVIEHPPGKHVNCHWLIHVPSSRKTEFKQKITTWLSDFAGREIDADAINIKSARTPRGAGKYMLKGMHPAAAAHYDIRHEPQGWIDGRRSGFTRNIGPKQKRRLRATGKYPPARKYKKNMYAATH